MTDQTHSARLRAKLAQVARSRDPEERSDLLAEVVDAGAAQHVDALAATDKPMEKLGLAILARQFKRVVPLSTVTPWQSDPDPQLRAAVVSAIVFRPVDPGVLQVVRAAVADPDERVRVAAIRAVKEHGDAQLQRELAGLNADPSDAVKRWLQG